jgi:hypothetical protein
MVNGSLQHLAYGAGHWVAGSDANTDERPLVLSPDGMTWVWPNTVPEGFEDCRGVAYGNGVFVALPAAGPHSLARSANAQDWTGYTHPWFTLRKGKVRITFGGGQFLAWSNPDPTVGVAVSTDGLNWQTRDTGTDQFITDAAFGDGRWVLVGNSGQVVTSVDLTTWAAQQIAFHGTTGLRLEGVTFGAGHWVIVGHNHHIWSSTSGEDWEPAFTTGLTGDRAILHDVAFDGQSFWVCGEEGMILQSQAVGSGEAPASLGLARTGNPREFLLTLHGMAGETYGLKYGTRWPPTSVISQATITLTNDVHPVLLKAPVPSATRYYWLAEP